MRTDGRLGSSFRDPSGYVFREGDRLRRHVAPAYCSTLDLLLASGLYDTLTKAELLIPHHEVEGPARTIEPEFVQTISYPYEWCFGEYKAAALATLAIQAHAIAKGLILKDASAYNIQFHRGKPTLIDSLSFEPYTEGRPWRAYRQFCEHFLAPLALMSLVDVRLGRLAAQYIDGIPLDLTSKLLPGSSKFSPGLGMHIHLHAKAQSSGKASVPKTQSGFSKASMMGLIDSLQTTIGKLSWDPPKSVWRDYYSETNYSQAAMDSKRSIVREWIGSPKLVWDLGANSGEFSRIAAEAGADVVSWDFDASAVEKNFRDNGQSGRILPLVVDLVNPSPALGWRLRERESLVERANADLCLALALIHHLTIGNNVPLDDAAAFFADISPKLLIEFVPKSDSQTQRLLATREDIYESYNIEEFKNAFGQKFHIEAERAVSGTDRTLFSMVRK